MKKFNLILVVLSIVLLLFAACNQKVTPEPAAKQPAAEQPVAEQPAAETLDPNRELNIFAVQHAECSWDSFWCTVQDSSA
ncbi:MAG: hypothetical protein CVU41_07070 [Chloroflexi bacterium HGW-Chloroflexi-3]|nr:MAG: hypothetical protein CVU41_07070 [Chloroflexi bacterium HGW-Chloroflexi-3]